MAASLDQTFSIACSPFCLLSLEKETKTSNTNLKYIEVFRILRSWAFSITKSYLSWKRKILAHSIGTTRDYALFILDQRKMQYCFSSTSLTLQFTKKSISFDFKLQFRRLAINNRIFSESLSKVI